MASWGDHFIVQKEMGIKETVQNRWETKSNLWYWDEVEAIFIAFGRLVLGLGISREPNLTQRCHEKWLRRRSRKIWFSCWCKWWSRENAFMWLMPLKILSGPRFLGRVCWCLIGCLVEKPVGGTWRKMAFSEVSITYRASVIHGNTCPPQKKLGGLIWFSLVSFFMEVWLTILS